MLQNKSSGFTQFIYNINNALALSFLSAIASSTMGRPSLNAQRCQP
jgi:hypothetical protein